jgi:peptidyl-prolyl cis-trans isomerase SurA
MTKMIMTAKFPHRVRALIASCVVALLLPLCATSVRAQTVAVMVNGEPITDYDIDQRTKLNFMTMHKKSERKEIIDELIDEKVKIKEAKKFGVDPGASDIDEAYAQMGQRMHITPAQLNDSLEKQGVRPETLKARIRADMVWGSLVRGRYREKLQVGEKDVNEAVKADGGEGQQQAEAFEYKLQPLVLIVPKGSAPSAIELRHKDAESLRARIESCEQAAQYFRAMANAAVRDPITRTSADIPANLRKLLDDTPVGHLTPPEVTKQGIEMVALCSRKPTTIDSPKKKEMRDKMYLKKYEQTSNAYLAEIRKAAMVEYRQTSAEDSNTEDGKKKPRRN